MVNRTSVPLRMLPGNVAILLELEEKGEKLHVNGISMRRDSEVKNGVILIVHGTDPEQRAEVGFKVRNGN